MENSQIIYSTLCLGQNLPFDFQSSKVFQTKEKATQYGDYFLSEMPDEDYMAAYKVYQIKVNNKKFSASEFKNDNGTTLSLFTFENTRQLYLNYKQNLISDYKLLITKEKKEDPRTPYWLKEFLRSGLKLSFHSDPTKVLICSMIQQAVMFERLGYESGTLHVYLENDSDHEIIIRAFEVLKEPYSGPNYKYDTLLTSSDNVNLEFSNEGLKVHNVYFQYEQITDSEFANRKGSTLGFIVGPNSETRQWNEVWTMKLY